MQEIIKAIKLYILAKLEVHASHEMEEIEYLKMQLADEKNERKKLQDYILSLNQPKAEEPQKELTNFKPIGQRYIPWNIRKQQLEAEDRKRFEISKRTIEEELTPKSVEELEQELLNG